MLSARLTADSAFPVLAADVFILYQINRFDEA